MKRSSDAAHAVILAGGRGTRFWPRSRTRTPKQLLNIVGAKTMLAQTVERLRSVFPPSRIWVVTNDQQVAAVRRQLPRVPCSQILAEPVGRNTAAAIGLAAVHIEKSAGSAARMAVLPADHYIAQPDKYCRIVRAALEVAAAGPNLVVLGVPPAHPETGYGYIERGEAVARAGGVGVFRVARFIEKPSLGRAKKYVASGTFDWNAGMFFWSVSTYLDCLARFLPAARRSLDALAAQIGTRRYARSLRRIYPKLENISVDYAILERATQEASGGNVFVLPADIGWSDIGSWAAVYQSLARVPGENVSAGPYAAIDAAGNFVWTPNKFAAVVGVRDLVIVETDDALLVCPRDRAQDVGKIVKWLEARKRSGLL